MAEINMEPGGVTVVPVAAKTVETLAIGPATQPDVLVVGVPGPAGPSGGAGHDPSPGRHVVVEHVDPTNTVLYSLLIYDDLSIRAVPLDALIRPNPPIGITAIAGVSYVKLTWTASPNTAQLFLYRDGVYQATLTGTSYWDFNITVNTTYSYTFRAASSSGMRGNESPPITARPDSSLNTPPSVVVGVWPATHQLGQKQVVRVSSSDIDAQTLAYALNTNVGSLEATRDPSVWLLTI